MGRIRVVCRTPPPPTPRAGYPRINLLPTLGDCEVYLVDDDGLQRSIDGVTRIEWSVSPNETATAIIEVNGVEIDVEALARRGGPQG